MPTSITKELIKIRDEATRLLELYELHKDSEDETLRRRVHVDLDKFLMQHREEATILMLSSLNDEIRLLLGKDRYTIWRRIWLALRGKAPAPKPTIKVSKGI